MIYLVAAIAICIAFNSYCSWVHTFGIIAHLKRECDFFATERNRLQKMLFEKEQEATDYAMAIKQIDDSVGPWLSAAIDDPKVCQEYKADIEEAFKQFGVIGGWKK
jgi:hypothetical protein